MNDHRPLPPAPASPPGKPTSPWAILGLAFELGYIIALPAVCLGFLGAYVDKTYGTLPLGTIVGMAFALVFSGLGIYRKLRTIRF